MIAYQMSAKPTDPSRLRQKLDQTERERRRHVERLLGERGPLVRGSFVAQPGRCGRPSCKCARGQFHDAAALYTRAEGRSVCTYVPRADREHVRQANQRDREFRKARATLAKLGRTTTELANQLQEALSEPYPPAGRTRQQPRRRRRKEPPP
jgi:hypothetical protein